MKATIIFLPPFLHSYENVPATIKNTTATTQTSSEESAATAGSGEGGGGGSCCHHREHKKYYYGKHAAARAATATKRQANKGEGEAPQQEVASRVGRGSRNVRDRCKSSHTQECGSEAADISTPMLPATVVASATDTAKTTTTTTTSTSTLQRDLSNESESDMDEAARAITAANSVKVVATTNRDALTKRILLKTTPTTNSKNTCLADSLNLRNPQLVMPIGESSRLGNATDDAEHARDTKDDRKAASGGAARAGASVANISQTTTTLECRCFRQNGDIIETHMSELKTLDDDECSLASRHSSRYDKLPRRTTTTTTATLQQLSQQIYTLCTISSASTSSASLAVSSSSSTSYSWWLTAPKTFAAPRYFLMFVMLMLLSSSANCWTGRQDVLSNCTFPARWEGSWFLSGYQQSIHIKGSQFSYRGKCAASDGNKYLIVDEKGCHRCLVIYEKHKNVLQYKESECEGDSMYMHQSNPSAMAMRSVLKQSDHRGGAHPNSNGHSRLSSSDQYIMRSNDDMNDYFCKGRETLQNLCDQIPGDALLYSLFRESAEPVKCPLKGPFIFTYNRGHGECKSPVSNIESCTEDSRLLLSFQACPDVQGTESTVEELTCLATWKDGNSRYLVGLVSHHHAISNEERYRCFVYEKISSLMGGPSIVSSKDAEYKLAQSGDATCNGLDSAEVGSRIMSLRKPPIAERCDFPAWFKGPRHWHGLMGNAVYNYHSNDGSVHIIKPNGYMETRALCEQINKQTSTEMMAVVHYTTGCQSGFMCMMFYRRDTHVIEIQTGKQASRLEDACAPDHFDINGMPYITLLANNPDPQICPMEGLYNLRGAIGPPYLTTRHKRNHNNKVHLGHGHHHGVQSEGNGHKRHATLSFRDSEKFERGSWHANTRGLPARSRRAAGASTTLPPVAAHLNMLQVEGGGAVGEEVVEAGNGAQELLAAPTNVTVGVPYATNELTTGRQRNRRDAPGCITNFKAQRQLWVGCTEPNVIDVRPLCNSDGDEEYSCHGSWAENSTVYIIARHKGTKHGVCISYRPTEGTAAKLVIGDACYRGVLKPPEHHLVANLSVFGKCGETGSASTHIHTNSWLATLTMVLLAIILGRQLQTNGADHR